LQRAKYVRLYADENGESHFEDMTGTLEAVDFAPPAPPLNVLSLFPATSCGLLGAPSDWDGQIPHPAPSRQVLCTVRGEYAIRASDGTERRFPPGSVLLLEDTTGRGHSSRVVGDDEVLIFTVALATTP
jgi:hypothetical protein